MLPRPAALILPVMLALSTTALASEEALSPEAQCGKKALETRAFSTAGWTLDSYDKAWKYWGDAKERPTDYPKAFMDRYGLHPAPFDNGKYPMGLREGSGKHGVGSGGLPSGALGVGCEGHTSPSVL